MEAVSMWLVRAKYRGAALLELRVNTIKSAKFI
jgi:hypothetical protein